MQTLWSPQTPAFWLALSAVSGGLLWLVGRRLSGGQRWLRIGWLLLPPYLGLLAGGLSPRLMGLSELDWVASLGIGTLLIVIALGLLTLVYASVSGSDTAAQAQPNRTSAASTAPWAARLTHLTEAGIQEFHWAFLRGGIWELLVLLQNPAPQASYWAIWLAALWAGAELLSTTTTLLSGIRVDRLSQAFMLVSTSVLYYYTRNFWLCWLLHGAANLLLRPHDPSPSPPHAG